MKITMTDQHYSLKIAGIISAFFISSVLWLMIIGAGRFILAIIN